MDFVHLHCHTHLSLMDGCLHHDNLFKILKNNNMNKVAITNHGHMINMPEIISYGEKAGIQVIPGAELYMCWDKPAMVKDETNETVFHIVLLAMNNTGYRNLIQLSTFGHLKGKYYKPRIDKEILEKHSEGIIVLSACVHGVIAGRLTHSKIAPEIVEQDVLWFKNTFKDRFYLEVQRHPNLPSQEIANAFMVEQARKHDIKLVATGDIHYGSPGDFTGWKTMMMLSTGMKFGEDADNDYYIKSPREMYDLFPELPEACSNTVEVANRCTPITFDKSIKYPPYDTKGLGPSMFLSKLAYEGLDKKINNKKINPRRRGEYIERMEYELEVLEKKNFSSYILIVADFCREAKSRGILMSPGRGSAAGSLVCYLTDITSCDPLSHDLLFERFINPERNSFPDIDSDFQDDRRGEMIEYVQQKYGEDKVCAITTLGTLGANAAVRDCCRRYGLDFTETCSIAELIPEMIRGRAPSIKEALEDPKFAAKIKEKAIYETIIRDALIIENMAKSIGTHAAGVIIGNEFPLTDYIALLAGKKGGIQSSSDEMKILETLGFIKMDFLGLKTLTIIKKTTELIYQNYGITINHEDIPVDDPEAFKLICEGKTDGLFQLSGSDGFRDVAMKFKPKDVNGMSDVNACYRPGALDNGFIEDYVANKERAEKGMQMVYPMRVDNPTKQKELEEILNQTYGVCIYQEQIQFIAQKMAGYSLGAADTLRRAMGKKDPVVMAESKKPFVAGCMKNGISEDSANHLFEQIAKFADYGFNKSHSAAYGITTIQTAWLKRYYPVEFYAACLSDVQKDMDKTIRFLNACKEEGIKILPPSINESNYEYAPVSGSIRFGLSAIKGIGDACINPILEERKKNGKFKSVKDLICRLKDKGLKKSDVTTLVRAGCFDLI